MPRFLAPRTLATVIGGAALWLAAALPAQAILYKGIIDPTFHAGGTVATGDPLGWSAEITFELDGCVGTFGLTTCSTMDLLTAIGTLYNTADPSHTPVSTPTVLNYLPGSSSTLINSVLFDSNGDVAGLNTAPIGHAMALATPIYLTNGAANLWLQFFAQAPILTLTSFVSAAVTPPATGGYLIVSPCQRVFLGETSGYLCSTDPSTGIYSDTATVTFEQISAVPEPGSLMLLAMAALAAVAAQRRRRALR